MWQAVGSKYRKYPKGQKNFCLPRKVAVIFCFDLTAAIHLRSLLFFLAGV
jgi:hypothetical protein